MSGRDATCATAGEYSPGRRNGCVATRRSAVGGMILKMPRSTEKLRVWAKTLAQTNQTLGTAVPAATDATSRNFGSAEGTFSISLLERPILRQIYTCARGGEYSRDLCRAFVHILVQMWSLVTNDDIFEMTPSTAGLRGAALISLHS